LHANVASRNLKTVNAGKNFGGRPACLPPINRCLVVATISQSVWQSHPGLQFQAASMESAGLQRPAGLHWLQGLAISSTPKESLDGHLAGGPEMLVVDPNWAWWHQVDLLCGSLDLLSWKPAAVVAQAGKRDLQKDLARPLVSNLA
jgi:hypothetical protein